MSDLLDPSAMDDKALAAAIHTEGMRALLKRIRAGEATAADLNVARQWVKDNGTQQLPLPGTVSFDLAKSLPFAGGDTPSH